MVVAVVVVVVVVVVILLFPTEPCVRVSMQRPSLIYFHSLDFYIIVGHQIKYCVIAVFTCIYLYCYQAKVLDRDGHNKMECPKGWQYNTDMAHTDVCNSCDPPPASGSCDKSCDRVLVAVQGHVSMLNCACWHPKVKDQFLTCSNDW